MVVTFSLIMGGWWLWRGYQQKHEPLPDAGGRQGRCVLWFIGSSSVHKWSTLARDMAPWITHNRGVNGATFAELAPRFADERETRRPEAIILYAGENDIANGRSAPQVLGDLDHFLAIKTRLFGDLPVLVLSMKPSPTRWANFAEQGHFNRGALQRAQARADLHYVNIVPLLLVNGRPGPFYVADGIHMNAAGYRLWAGAVRGALRDTLPPQVVRTCDPALSRPAAPAGAAAGH